MNDHVIFTVDDPLWLDALYLRHRPSSWPFFHFINVQRNAELSATGLTIQGNGGLNTSVHLGDHSSKAIYQGVPWTSCTLPRACTCTCRGLPRDRRRLHNDHDYTHECASFRHCIKVIVELFVPSFCWMWVQCGDMLALCT